MSDPNIEKAPGVNSWENAFANEATQAPGRYCPWMPSSVNKPARSSRSVGILAPPPPVESKIDRQTLCTPRLERVRREISCEPLTHATP
jgi:hypothetical protein